MHFLNSLYVKYCLDHFLGLWAVRVATDNWVTEEAECWGWINISTYSEHVTFPCSKAYNQH